MTASTWIYMINLLLGEVFGLWQAAKQSKGEEIPSWDELMAKNSELAKKIETEMKK